MTRVQPRQCLLKPMVPDPRRMDGARLQLKTPTRAAGGVQTALPMGEVDGAQVLEALVERGVLLVVEVEAEEDGEVLLTREVEVEAGARPTVLEVEVGGICSQIIVYTSCKKSMHAHGSRFII
jgi:hypothetical protein